MNQRIKSPLVREMIAQMPKYTVCGSAETRNVLTPDEFAIEEARAAQEAILHELKPKKQKQDALRQRRQTKREVGALRYFEFFLTTGNRNMFMIKDASACVMLAGATRACKSMPYRIGDIVRELYANRENITQ